MTQPSFFDANAMVGNPVFSPTTGTVTGYACAADLLPEMDHHGISGGLVTHWDATFHAASGNRRLTEEIEGSNRLFPCWVVLPHHTGEMDEPKKLVKKLVAGNVKAVKLLPVRYQFSLEPWSVGGLLRELARHGIVTFIELPGSGRPVGEPDEHALSTLLALCREYPELPVVASAALRKLYPLLDRCRNLYVSTAWEPHPGMLEDVAERFGAERILFATPHCEIADGVSGAAKAMVMYADLKDGEKSLIAGGNLRRLLGVVRLPSPGDTVRGKIQRCADAGSPVGVEIIDNHLHLGPNPSEYKPSWSEKQLLRTMERIGSMKACANSTVATWGGNHVEENTAIAAACRRHPDRLIGFAVINPRFENAAGEIRRCFAMGMRGLKIHPRIHACDLGDARYIPVWEASERHGIPVLAHTGRGQAYSEPGAFDAIAGRHPKGTFILGHSGETFEGIRISIEIARKRKNVFLDMSGWGFMRRGVLEYAVRHAGVDKVLFGSDYSWVDIPYHLGIVFYAGLTDAEKTKVLGSNARRILGIRREK